MVAAAVDATANNKPVSLEDKMQPGVMSTTGFLKKGEKLMDVLKRDNATLKQLQLDPKSLAFRLDELFKRVQNFDDYTARMEQRGIEMFILQTRGFQECPFEEPHCPRASLELVINLKSTGKTYTISELLPHLISEHGFFEGDVPYRIGPEELNQLLNTVDTIANSSFKTAIDEKSILLQEAWTVLTKLGFPEERIQKFLDSDYRED